MGRAHTAASSASSKNAQVQAALALALRDAEIVESVRVYDPVLSEAERDALARLGMAVMLENQEGRHEAAAGGTLFFLPHVGRPLFNAILWANWTSPTADVLLLSNLPAVVEEQEMRRDDLSRDHVERAKPVLEHSKPITAVGQAPHALAGMCFSSLSGALPGQAGSPPRARSPLRDLRLITRAVVEDVL